MWLSFSRPLYLLLVPAVGALFWHSTRTSYADLTGARRWVAMLVRIVLLLALILALAGARLVKESEEMVVAFAIDASLSVPLEERSRALGFVEAALEHRGSQDRGALVVFGREAAVESENLRQGGSLRLASQPSPTHTDIAAAMRLALGLLPPESAGKIVLLSDGNENAGAVAQELLLARANRVPVDVVPLTTRTARDALVRDVSVPSEARLFEPFPVRVAVESTIPTEAVVTVLADDEPLETRSVILAAGATALKIPISLAEAGFHEVEVLLEMPGDTSSENNRGVSFVRIRGEPRVLVVDGDPQDAADLARALEVQEIAADVGGGTALPTNTADIERYDSILLSNYPAYNMDWRQMQMLRDATRDLGIGLGMIGGEESFGAGGYYATPVEEALPVDMDATKHRVLPASAVLMVMDTSGSMGAIEDGREKIELAAEAACAVVDLLQPHDSVGLIASDPRPTAVCPLRRVQAKSAVKRDICSVRAGGGGIACYPSLGAAYEVLRGDESSIRHIILLADGSDCDEQTGCVALVSEMAKQKISVTAVAFGDGDHVPFLKEVAAAGGGAFYLTEFARDLKQIFTRETLTVAKSALVEEEFRPRLADDTSVMQGVDWASAPPLLGYVATSPKALARVPLVSHKDDPVFAHWQYGLGRSIAFTSDAKAHWAAHWLGWDGFTQFWSQAVRWSLRQLSSEVLYPQIRQEGDTARIVVDAVAQDGSLLNGLEMSARVDLPGGGRAEVELAQTAPGRYEGTAPSPESGSYIVGLTAESAGGFQVQQTVGFAVAYPPDLADTKAQLGFLEGIAEQTRGRVLADPRDVFTRPAAMPRVPISIWRGLLWAAVCLIPVDVAVRRLVIQRAERAAFWASIGAVAGRFAARTQPKVQPPGETMRRLLARKDASRASAVEESGEPRRQPAAADHRAARPEPRAAPRRTAPAGEDTPAARSTASRLLESKRRRRQGGNGG